MNMHTEDNIIVVPGDRLDRTDQSVSPSQLRTLRKGVKPIVYNSAKAVDIDEETVAFEFYNCFNYSLLPKRKHDVRLTMGITSANRGEGKTLVSSNLAVSLTRGYQKKTVLVDLNIQRPRLHEVFGTPLAPGLMDALHNG